MSTLILTRPNTAYTQHNKISLNHNWDVSAKPFIPRSYDVVTTPPSRPPATAAAAMPTTLASTSTSSPPRVAAVSTSPEQQHHRLQQRQQPLKNAEISKNCIGNKNHDPVSLMLDRASSGAVATQNVHIGNHHSGGNGIGGGIISGSNDAAAVRMPSVSKTSSTSSSASSSSSTTPHSSRPSKTAASPLQPPYGISLCEKPARKTPLMSTTEYFMERWNEKNDISSVTHAILEGTYLKSRENPQTSTIPSLFGRDSPFPPVLINQLPSLMSIWKLPNESASFTAGILGAHPEFAVQVFRHHEGKK